jgi:uncharacterized protein YggE
VDDLKEDTMIRTIMMTAVAMLFSFAAGAGEEAPLSFTVSGYGKVFYDADTVDLVFGVTTEDPDVTVCWADHSKRTKKVRAWVTGNLPQNSIFAELSSDLSIKTTHNRQTSYVFQTLFSLRSDVVDRLGELQGSLVNAGVNRIVNVKLLSSGLPELEDEARKLAISDAKSKAELVAAELNWRLLGATNVRFDDSTWKKRSFAQSYGSRVNMTAPSQATSAGSEVYVDAAVTVTFAFEQQ